MQRMLVVGVALLMTTVNAVFLFQTGALLL